MLVLSFQDKTLDVTTRSYATKEPCTYPAFCPFFIKFAPIVPDKKPNKNYQLKGITENHNYPKT
jgi:hypothetical protein